MHCRTQMLTAGVLGVMTAGSGWCVPAHVLAESGRSAYTIAVSSDATAPERHAAAELASVLGQVSGADFGVTTRDSRPVEPTLVVGPSVNQL